MQGGSKYKDGWRKARQQNQGSKQLTAPQCELTTHTKYSFKRLAFIILGHMCVCHIVSQAQNDNINIKQK